MFYKDGQAIIGSITGSFEEEKCDALLMPFIDELMNGKYTLVEMGYILGGIIGILLGSARDHSKEAHKATLSVITDIVTALLKHHIQPKEEEGELAPDVKAYINSNKTKH